MTQAALWEENNRKSLFYSSCDCCWISMGVWVLNTSVEFHLIAIMCVCVCVTILTKQNQQFIHYWVKWNRRNKTTPKNKQRRLLALAQSYTHTHTQFAIFRMTSIIERQTMQFSERVRWYTIASECVCVYVPVRVCVGFVYICFTVIIWYMWKLSEKMRTN